MNKQKRIRFIDTEKKNCSLPEWELVNEREWVKWLKEINKYKLPVIN